MILEKERKLSLEDPLEKYFPNFKNPEIGRKVKIIHLLDIVGLLEISREKPWFTIQEIREDLLPIMYGFHQRKYSILFCVIHQNLHRGIENLFWRKHGVLGNKTAMNRSQLYAKTWNQAAHFELEYPNFIYRAYFSLKISAIASVSLLFLPVVEINKAYPISVLISTISICPLT